MAGDVDIVIQSQGGPSFQPLDIKNDVSIDPTKGAGIDTTAYERVKKNRNLTRPPLLSIHCGADGDDLATNRDALLAEIDKATNNQNGRIGALCLFGTSNGCGVILALAKALQKRSGAPKCIYIGLGNVTMIPFKRNPPVVDIGDLQPINCAKGFLRIVEVFTGRLSRVGVPPSVSDAPPPTIIDPGVVADTRKNLFTVAGNRARVVGRSPAGLFSWWWAADSTMKFGEVHGEIPGWTNLPRKSTGSDDFAHHFNLCENIAIPEMRSDIAKGAGEVPDQSDVALSRAGAKGDIQDKVSRTHIWTPKSNVRTPEFPT